MNIFICTTESIPGQGVCLPDWTQYEGEHAIYCSCYEWPRGMVPDALVCMGTGSMHIANLSLLTWPRVSFYAYHWDCYHWVWRNPRPGEADYSMWGDMLKQAKEVWVPSNCTRVQAHQWWGVDTKVILSSVPYWDYKDIQDGGYVLCTLRHLPDRHVDWFVRACCELGLEAVSTNHEESYNEYQKKVAHCRGIVSHYYEASTGGLSLLEAAYHGKPVLITDSPWNGAVDYFGDRATYYDHNSFDHFKLKLKQLAGTEPQHDSLQELDRVLARAWIESKFSHKRMATQIVERIEQCEQRKS